MENIYVKLAVVVAAQQYIPVKDTAVLLLLHCWQ